MGSLGNELKSCARRRSPAHRRWPRRPGARDLRPERDAGDLTILQWEPFYAAWVSPDGVSVSPVLLVRRRHHQVGTTSHGEVPGSRTVGTFYENDPGRSFGRHVGCAEGSRLRRCRAASSASRSTTEPCRGLPRGRREDRDRVSSRSLRHLLAAAVGRAWRRATIAAAFVFLSGVEVLANRRRWHVDGRSGSTASCRSSSLTRADHGRWFLVATTEGGGAAKQWAQPMGYEHVDLEGGGGRASRRPKPEGPAVRDAIAGLTRSTR